MTIESPQPNSTANQVEGTTATAETVEVFAQDLMEEIKNEIRTTKSSIEQEAETTGEANEKQCNNIVSEIQRSCRDAKKPHVIIAISILLQRGATSPKTPGNKQISFGTATITVDTIRKACKNEKCTTRQFARGMKNIVISVMENLGEAAPDGNLAKLFKTDVKNVTKQELIWASDFQTYNENCPDKVKNWLLENYKERFKKRINE